VSLPAGTEGMGPVRFGLLTACGSGLWNLLWLWVGWLVGARWTDVGRWSDWFNWSIVIVGVVLVVRYVWRRRARL
jgi:membrane protein DedA with SNARE-associated domain